MFLQPSLLPPMECERHHLGEGAWIDLVRGWVGPEADRLFSHLLHTVAWRAERRPMYDRIVDVPRLLAWFDADDPWPDPLLRELCDRLNARYPSADDDPFVTLGLCLYRDGRDSVAWHGDTLGAGRPTDALVAIVSLGATRRLALRPRGGGPSRSFALAHGDLLVMGGSCQRTWDHAVPKTSRPVGPRISVQLRPRGVR